MITYQVEDVRTVLTEGFELFYEHWDSIAMYKDDIKLDPNVPLYLTLEDQNRILAVTVRESGRLVGYSASILSESLHYRGHIFAHNDVIFIHPDYRKGRVGIKLIRYTEQLLKERGVSVYYINTKSHVSFAPILERMGYNDTEHQYSKYIGD